jgi:hypothetical protein
VVRWRWDCKGRASPKATRLRKMPKFSLDALVNLASASGLIVHIQVAEAA